MARFFVSFFLSLMVLASAAQAQRAPEPPGKEARPPAAAPAPTTLESLFDRLAQAKDASEARIVANQIERRWQRSGSETADLLMGRAVQVMNGKDRDTALDLLDYIILLKPEWAEPYNRRATLMFMMDDYDGSLRDIRATLAREPRHYGALAGLGMIMQRMENQKAAYAAFSRALEIHPHLERIKDAVQQMKLEVEDRKL